MSGETAQQHKRCSPPSPPSTPQKAEFSAMTEIKEELLHTKSNRCMREATGASTRNELGRGHRSRTRNGLAETRGLRQVKEQQYDEKAGS